MSADLHAVMMTMYNTTAEQLVLTKMTVESVLRQDIGPLHLWMVNNGGNQETREWLDNLRLPEPHQLTREHYPANVAPTKVFNHLAYSFFALGHDKVLAVPNDTILPPNLYSELVKWSRGVVAAWANNGTLDFTPTEKSHATGEDPYISVALTRKWCFDALVAKDGYFLDERYFMYCCDCDLKLRLHACGIRGIQLDIQYGHYGSGCWRLAPPEISRSITDRADEDRARFVEKWGFPIGSPEHVAADQDINFVG